MYIENISPPPPLPPLPTVLDPVRTHHSSIILVSSLALDGVPCERWMLFMAVVTRWYRVWNSGPISRVDVTASHLNMEEDA